MYRHMNLPGIDVLLPVIACADPETYVYGDTFVF